jgi:hypothetical protein
MYRENEATITSTGGAPCLPGSERDRDRWEPQIALGLITRPIVQAIRRILRRVLHPQRRDFLAKP